MPERAASVWDKRTGAVMRLQLRGGNQPGGVR